MSRIPRNAKRDANEPSVVEALEAYGWAVLKVSSKGAPDLVAMKQYRSENSSGPCYAWRFALIECKSRKGKLTPAQERWLEVWRGPAPVVVRSVEDVQRL